MLYDDIKDLCYRIVEEHDPEKVSDQIEQLRILVQKYKTMRANEERTGKLSLQ